MSGEKARGGEKKEEAHLENTDTGERKSSRHRCALLDECGEGGRPSLALLLPSFLRPATSLRLAPASLRPPQQQHQSTAAPQHALFSRSCTSPGRQHLRPDFIAQRIVQVALGPVRRLAAQHEAQGELRGYSASVETLLNQAGVRREATMEGGRRRRRTGC
jgi:hypothetical protein